MNIRKTHGYITTGIFVFYALFVHAWILPMFTFIIRGSHGGTIAGVILVLVLLLETIGIWVKAPEIYAKFAQHERVRSSAVLSIWILHLAVMAFLLMFGLRALGMDFDRNAIWFSLFMILGVVREIILLVRIISSQDTIKIYNRTREIIADILLTIFLCVGYTAIWETITSKMEAELMAGGLLMIAVYGFILVMLFLVFFLPLRMMFLLEDILTFKTRHDWALWVISLALAALAGVVPIFLQ